MRALASNLRRARELARERRLIAVVKADAYGHGVEAIAPVLVREGVEALAVATLEEARQLRAIGLVLPVLLLEGLHRASDAEEIIARGFMPAVVRFDMLDALAVAAKRLGRRAMVHIKLDTGMSRLGFPPEELASLIERFGREPHLEWAGLMTHLAEADDPKSPETSKQRSCFEDCLREVRAAGFDPAWVHADPSAGLYRKPTACATAVRPGLMLYGADPTLERRASLLPVMNLFSRVMQVRDVPAGTRVGYGGSFVTSRPTRLLTLPIGYADGLPRAAGGRIQVAVEGVRCPLVGRVSMDLAVVDAGPGGRAELDGEVLIFGRRGGIRLPVEEVADAVETIAYEIFTGIGARVPRIVRPRGSV